MGGMLDNFFSKSEQKKLAEFSRRAKKELSSLPLISAIGDSLQGASGLGELQQNLIDHPDNPKNWLFYFEAFTFYKRINSGVNVGRGVINPVGFFAGKGISKGLNTLDDTYESFDPIKCLGMTIALSMKRIKDKNRKILGEDLVILAKALGYSAASANTINQRNKMLNYGIDYMSRAIQVEKNQGKKAEYLFYLSQLYDQGQKKTLKLRTLNISRKLGFQPADKLLKSLLKKKLQDNNDKLVIDQTVTNTPYRAFYLTYYPDIDSRIENTWEHVKKQQQKKLSETGKRIGSFLDKHL
ncbi:hypothetical protein BK139_14875 [Paenibacillus sp. FSL R5-0490]|uniref:hypothetical protein n=1 Tax=Paenibacillus sp. FSL R5-0490 TaxID=1920424 RepID=UPI00096CFF45|nr:hypothetical protein [Paenibacillus sp. FSL R5-0490]OMF56579.1 hypothetical protein BK139_14875 [Paenibacillus sp. FSL R5-0490]